MLIIYYLYNPSYLFIEEEINSNGGKAIADFSSVSDASSIVENTLKNFGKIDILINNAGILRSYNNILVDKI